MSLTTEQPVKARRKPYVRPWALATPILVLLVCLPILRPLRQPGRASDEEQARLATIAALVEHRSDPGPLAEHLAIDSTRFVLPSHVIEVDNHVYSDQPPMLAFLMSGPALVLEWLGYP